MSKQPRALEVASELDWPDEDGFVSSLDQEAAALLRSQHAFIAEMVEALRELDEAYCRAGTPLSRDERNEDRRRLVAARNTLSKAKDFT